MLGLLLAVAGQGVMAAASTHDTPPIPGAPLVLTGTQATYSITSALAQGTPLAVRNVPPDGRELALQKDYIERRLDRLAPEFRQAAAVVTLTNALPQDPLYRFAREANIRVVNIDAALPWSLSAAGAALADTPTTSVSWGGDPDRMPAGTAPYLWLGTANVLRMADLIGADLAVLFPDSASAIAGNLESFKRLLQSMRSRYETQLLEAGGEPVFALTGDLVYFTNDLGLPVDGYFIKQDVRWTASDLAALTRHLREGGIRVVLHRWQPSEAIQAAVREAGAQLVVLETGDPGRAVEGVLPTEGLQEILRANLEALVQALRAP